MRFTAELVDYQGNVTRYVSGEIKCDEDEWVGKITDGDKSRLKGEYGKDGILHAQRALNLTTNSIVGQK